jgi:ubiquinone biosynthesis protein COQ4
MPSSQRSDSRTAYRRDWGKGLRALGVWIANPVSEKGATHVPRMVFAVAGPEVASMVGQMRDDSDGRRLLAARSDLGAALNDHEALAAMPAGSLGRTYHEFMSGPGVIPGYVIAGLMYRDGAFEALEWDDDMKYVVERLGNTHDMTHVLSGYGTDLAAEAININFSLGLFTSTWAGGVPGALFGAGSGLVLLPKVGLRRWYRLADDAYQRGRAAARRRPFHCVPFEDLLPEPLDDVRHELGIPPMRHPFDSSDWLRSPIGKAMANGFGEASETGRKAAVVKHVVEAGVPIRNVMQAPDRVFAELSELVEKGASDADLRALVGV